MSLLLFLFYWVAIPAAIFLMARRFWRNAETALSKGVVLGVTSIIFMGLLWLAAGEKWWLDYQVRQLCAEDGGVRVYETVKLPAEKFNKYGQINFYRPKDGENALGSEYLLKWDIQYYRKGNPSLHRSHTQIFRKSDGKLLGESVGYSRGGGDLPGPWHPSSFSCPDKYGQVPLLNKIFIKLI